MMQKKNYYFIKITLQNMNRIFLIASLIFMFIGCKNLKSNNSEVFLNQLNKSDSVAIFQACLDSKDLSALYQLQGDTILTIYGNGYIRTNYPLHWKNKEVEYVSPVFYRGCLKDEFIIQFIKFEIVSNDSVNVSLCLNQQGSVSNFYLRKKDNQWTLMNYETEMY